jgi:hypothetical protein
MADDMAAAAATFNSGGYEQFLQDVYAIKRNL